MKKALIALLFLAFVGLVLAFVVPERQFTVPEPEDALQIKEIPADVFPPAPVPTVDPRPEAIDAYFKERGMPLEGMGKMFVREADRNGFDYRLLAAISVRESSGGKNACGTNAFGWHSCKINENDTLFRETTEGWIEYISSRFKASSYYAGKGTRGILNTYNPESIVPGYANQVMAIMRTIGPDPE